MTRKRYKSIEKSRDKSRDRKKRSYERRSRSRDELRKHNRSRSRDYDRRSKSPADKGMTEKSHNFESNFFLNLNYFINSKKKI